MHALVLECVLLGRGGLRPVTLRCFVQPVKVFFYPPGQSNPPTLPPPPPPPHVLIPRRFTRSSGDSVKSRGQITSLFANPPETCAKKLLAHLERQLTLVCRDTCV